MTEKDAVEIIMQALMDNASQSINYLERYHASCTLDELVEQIIDRLRSRGAFQKKQDL